MPVAAKKPCKANGCRELVSSGFCSNHLHLAPKRLIDSRRGNANSRGYNYCWQQARARWLADHPLCVSCDEQGLVVAGFVVDHIVPHRGDMTLFWDETNWQTLCASCHSRKTANEDCGFSGSHN